DGGQEGGGGGDGVRRVVAPAEAGLDHGDVDALLCELRERRCGEHLELRRASGLWTNAPDRALEVGLLAADADAFRPAANVRRVVRADAQAFPRQQLLDRSRRRALAVRADDVNRRVRVLGLAEVAQQ